MDDDDLIPDRSIPRDALVASAMVGGINALIWSVLVMAVRVSWDANDENTALEELEVGGVTLLGGLVVVALCLVTRLPRRPRWVQWAGALVLSAVLGAVRTVIDQLVLPIPDAVWWQWGISVAGYLVVASPAILVSNLVVRRWAEQEARRAERERNRAATAALEADEAELRRKVAEHLHGTVQNRLVLVGAGLDQLAVESDAEGRPDRADTLRAWVQMIDTVREQDVRVISHQVFPTGLDLGLAQALGLLLDRLPTSVATSMHLGDGVREADQALPLADRFIVAAIIEEGLTNALRHGRANRVGLALDVADGALTVTLDDNGVGLPAGGVLESGLLRHRARVESRGGRIDLTDRPGGGTRLRVTLPVG